MADEFVDRLTVALWVFDLDEKRILWANRAALEVWQAETLEALRDRDLGVDMCPSLERRLAQYRDDFVSHDATFSDLWTLYLEGVPTTMQVVYRGFRLEDGRTAIHCEGTKANGITPETQRSADALLHTSFMISWFRANGEQLYRNPAARIAYGGAPMKFAEQFAASKDKDGLDVELNSKGTVNRIAQMKTSSGIRWHEITARHGKDPLTGETCILVSEVDISKVKATENRLRDIVEVSSDWFWEMDEDLRYTYFSERASEYSSIDPNSLIGKKRSDFILEMDDNWRAHLDDLDNRRPFRDFRFTKGDLEGRVRHTSVSGVPIYDEDGNFKGYRGAGTDITEHVEGKRRIAAQKQLEVELAKEREINGLQRQFVSMTPLAIIDGSAQRLARKLETMTPTRVGETLQKIRLSVTRLTGLVESVLNAARLEEGRIACTPEPCDLKEIIREIYDGYVEVYPEHTIDVDIDGLPHQIVADPKLARQIVSNLPSNAVRYSPAGTTVWIQGSTAPDTGNAVISVRDEGVGIPKDEIEKLGNRFFRARTSTGIVGSGIGLHLVQHFIAMHGGRMDVASTEGEGSTFTVSLPKTPPDHDATTVDIPASCTQETTTSAA